MSIFASETTKTIPIPFDAPHTVTIQKLTGRALEQAQAAHLAATVAGKSPRGWAGVFQRALAKGTAAADGAAAQILLVDPLNGFDRSTVVRGGVKAWSYQDAQGMKALSAIDDLDDEALEFFAVEVMRLTKPHLFQTAEEREGEQKNG